jgi:thiamine-monophosphate kinase
MSPVYVADLTESELVARIQSHLPPPPAWLSVGIGDDAAVVEPARNRLEVLSVDALVEGVHFDRRFTPAGAIGHRALAVNLSDLAAMGAEPRLALLSLVLPADLAIRDFDAMIEGLAKLAVQERLHVVGGNLTQSPGPLVVDITVSGTVKRRQALSRRGARPGDLVFLSGSIGAAAAGLQMLKAGGVSRETCTGRYLFPDARVRLGVLAARNRAASSCIDLSDGLADGVQRLAAASGVGIRIDAAALPIEPDARRWFESKGDDAILEAVDSGDDYELLFTVRPQRVGRMRTALKQLGDVIVTEVGVCTSAKEVVLDRAGELCPMSLGYKHFG